MTNFDFLKNEPKFKDFADVAISAERIFQFDYAASVLNCRRAMEFAVKWMYSVDSALVMPWDDRLVSLMSTDEFRDIIDADLLKRMEFIRKTGNFAAHTRSESKEGTGRIVSAKSIYFSGFCCLLLRRSLHCQQL